MISTASKSVTADGAPLHLEMTVLELAIFLCVYRAKSPQRLSDIAATLGQWFDGQVALTLLNEPIAHMTNRAWLIPHDGAVRASREGRDAARPLVEGIIRILDQGTRLFDVALMMSVLRLTKGELDSGHDF